MKFWLRVISYGLLVTFFAAGCGPTYPKEKLAESIVKLCEKEYKQDVDVKVAGKTVYIYTELGEGLFDKNLAPQPEAMDKIGDVLLASARGVLSSNAQVDFCVIVARDKKMRGFEWRLTRHVNDIKRFFLSDISRGDFFERADFDVKFDEKVSLGKFAGEEVPREIKLGDFLAKQIAKRAKSALFGNKSLSGKFAVKSVDGKFYGRHFGFLIDGAFSSGGQAADGKNAIAADEVVGQTLKVVEWLTRDYGFEDFDTVSVMSAGGGSAVVDRKALRAYRRWKAR